jgi:phosphatidate cytidylyltransferase
MLKHRFISGTAMTVFVAGLIILDGWLDGSITTTTADDKNIKGTLTVFFLIAVLILAQIELAKLISKKGLGSCITLNILASAILGTIWYWRQFITVPMDISLMIIIAVSMLALIFGYYIKNGINGVIANSAVGLFSIIYFGLFGSLLLGIRIEFGLWPLLMTIFTIKCSDIGAYTFGNLFGKHKFSPIISPGKTWEGLAGAVIAGVLISLVFAIVFDIISWPLGMVFGAAFAVIGQFGDLVESLIKRDTGQKDSAGIIPGFGGILDVIDSPLAAAPFAYLFFKMLI